MDLSFMIRTWHITYQIEPSILNLRLFFQFSLELAIWCCCHCRVGYRSTCRNAAYYAASSSSSSFSYSAFSYFSSAAGMALFLSNFFCLFFSSFLIIIGVLANNYDLYPFNFLWREKLCVSYFFMCWSENLFYCRFVFCFLCSTPTSSSFFFES